jgi:hypothetical protein
MRAALRDRVRGAWICAGLCLLAACGASPPPEQPASRSRNNPPSAPPPAPSAQALAVADNAPPPRMMQALRAHLAPPERELPVSVRADGVRRVALERQLQHATLVVRGADGRLHRACVDDYAAAVRALGVAPDSVTQ